MMCLVSICNLQTALFKNIVYTGLFILSFLRDMYEYV